jgi:DNA-binding CsgD family transcriptional regulator
LSWTGSAVEFQLKNILLKFQPDSNDEIVEKLVGSEKTVSTRVSHILAKLQLATRTLAALYALKEGLASL